MALTITISLNDLDEKCVRYFAADPEEWVNNFIQARIFSTKQEIYQNEIRRMTEDPNISVIPANIDAVVSSANIVFANTQPEIPPMGPQT